jgi:O-antigen ligase
MIGPNESVNSLSKQAVIAFIYLAIITVLYLYFGLSLPLYLLFILMSAIFIMPSSYYLGLSLMVVLTMVFEKFFTLESLTIGREIYKLYPIDIIMAFTILALFIAVRINKEKIKWLFGWPEKLLVFFLFLVAAYLIRSFFDINANFASAFSSFKNYFWYPLIYFMVIYAIQTPQRLKNFVHIMLLCGIGIIGFLAYGIINGQGLWTEFTPLSTSGIRILAGTHAFYLCITFVIALSLLTFERFQNKNFTQAILWIWAIGIIGSMMRHLWLGFGVGLIILFAFLPKKNKKNLISYGAKNILIALTVILLIILLSSVIVTGGSTSGNDQFFTSLQNRAVSFLNTSDDTSATWRLDLWRDAKNKWLDNPLWGVGYGKTLSLETFDWHTYEEIRNLHNSPLAIAVQMGALGLVAFLIFCVGVLVSSFKYIYKDPELTPYYIGIIAAIAIMGFASLFQPYLEANFTGIFLWLMLGLLGTSRIINSSKDKELETDQKTN